MLIRHFLFKIFSKLRNLLIQETYFATEEKLILEIMQLFEYFLLLFKLYVIRNILVLAKGKGILLLAYTTDMTLATLLHWGIYYAWYLSSEWHSHRFILVFLLIMLSTRMRKREEKKICICVPTHSCTIVKRFLSSLLLQTWSKRMNVV